MSALKIFAFAFDVNLVTHSPPPDSDFTVGLFKRFKFAGIPQSVTVPPGSDKAFISDIEGNTVYFVVGFHPHPLRELIGSFPSR